MKNYLKNHFVLFLVLIGFVLVGINSVKEHNSNKIITEKKITKLSKKAKKKARDDFFFNIIRDPQTNTIPKNIRTKELNHAKSMPSKNSNFLAKADANEFEWFEVGPNDVGGRTRALAVDVTNSNTVIAAGVSGGIWKSTNNGDTWEFKNKSSELLSITSIVQDPRPGFTNNWYACGGEFDGSSASDRGYRAYFRGNGILKSTDNGENWNLIMSTASNPTIWDSDYDYMSKLVINPISGTLFGVSNGFGIIKSSDGGESFSTAIGGFNDHYYSDVAVKSDGTLVAVLSTYNSSSDTERDNTPGVYKSSDDGETWTDITPADFPVTHERSVLACSELSTPIFYVLSHTGDSFSATNSNGQEFENEAITLFKLSTDNSVSENLSANLPSFQAYFDGQGYLLTQGNYNMVIAVKPDDDNFVLIAGTSLFRSTNGFSSKISNNTLNWIGGYHGVDPFYPNLHPDIHKITFDPNDPNKVWVGHDGGLSYTDNITNESYTEFLPWVTKNNGYNVTQFFTVSIHKDAGDNRIMGGTQDNGTPYFRYDNLTTQTEDISSGDGAYCYFSSGSFAYSSIYNGNIYRFKYNSQGDPTWDAVTTDVTPPDAEGQLFINPFVIDPNPTERYMYYPAGNTLWRNNDIRQQNDEQPLTRKWEELPDLAMPIGHTITTLSVSTSNPEHVLYYGAYNSSDLPKIYRLTSSHTATSGYTDVSVPDVSSGSYIHDIAINPDNANEIIAVFSNYNIEGLYHSTDGGTTYSAIEGNLIGDENNAGPSLRRALIVPYNNSLLYFVASSTGLYSTTTLDGANTIWTLESPTGLGNVVVEYLDYRSADNTIAVGTHGRGIFLGMPSGTVDVGNNELENNFTLRQNYPNPFNPSTKIEFNIAKSEKVDLTVYNSLGEKVQTLLSKNLIAGNYSVDFNGTSLASGIYYYKLTAGNFVSTKKMILLK